MPGSIPLWVKIVYSAFLAVMIPNYLRVYGPTNFLYFCDVAALLTFFALWSENALLASAAAVGIVLPQLIWVLDLAVRAFGWEITGMSAYMFNSRIPVFTRALSLFHGWLPFFLLYVVSRLHYDRRALALWTAMAVILILVCYFWMPAPGHRGPDSLKPVNINYVYGLTDDAPQHWMPAWAWLGTELLCLPLLVWLPTHLFLARVFGSRI